MLTNIFFQGLLFYIVCRVLEMGVIKIFNKILKNE